jgi:hypothetical protein
LTLKTRGEPSEPSRVHSRAWRQAFCKTQCPRGIIRSVSSALQFQPLPRSGIHAPVEHLGAPFAFLLGFVQRHIRVAQEGVRVGYIGFAESDTNARADIDLTNSQLHGSLHHFVHPVGDFDHVVDIRDAVQNDGELVPAEPGRGIGGTQTG